ncbi:hypothetical protein XBFFL1_1830005 [Xenorhabdus bovienii str. feltiae Florida]|nr:hypothetical protein XBFFR1_1920004 [Xenorhabdus bovienii str. feltiae France]CDG91790.1 hypothetical protein XBFFL1_1830005 [Xenorhabdus bovienii str. feltiae Florida]
MGVNYKKGHLSDLRYNLVEPLGIEPSPNALQASARTLYAKVPDMKKATPKCSLEFELVGLANRLDKAIELITPFEFIFHGGDLFFAENHINTLIYLACRGVL